ncbi:hypothetical protein TWF281_003752 [Arthrobotrys megalospora]
MENRIIQSRPEKPTRSYLRLEEMEDHKDFILSERRAGMKQKAILNVLKTERGVTLPIHKLKRMLDKWEQSHKNLTKKRKLNIRDAITKRQRLGKETHKVALKRSRKNITKEQMDAITGASPGYFKNIKPNSEDVVVLSTPTPGSEYEAGGENEVELSGMDTANDIPGDVPPELSPPPEELQDEIDDEIDDNSLQDFDEMDIDGDPYHRPDPTSLSVGYSSELEEEGTSSSEEDNEPLDLVWYIIRAKAYIRLGRDNKNAIIAGEDNYLASSRNIECTDEELQEIISAEFSKMHPAEEPKPCPESGAVDSSDLNDEVRGSQRDDGIERGLDVTSDVEHETPLSRYARQHRHYFWAEVRLWEYEAKEFIEEVESTSEKRGVSLQKAEDIVSQRERSGLMEMLPYHIYKQIMGEDADIDCRAVPDSVNGALVCQIVQGNFTTLENAARQLPFDNNDRKLFNFYVVHLPFVLSKYGLNHFFTAYTLHIASHVLDGLGVVDEQYGILRASALCAYDSIGMGFHRLALDCLGWELTTEPELALACDRATDNIRKAVLQKYGRSHPKTLHLYSIFAWEMIDSSQEDGIHRQQQGELMAYGILQTVKETYQIYPDSLKDRMMSCLRNLGYALLRCGRSDLVTSLLAEPSCWEGQPGVSLPLGPAWSCKHIVGLAYADVGRHKEALHALFACFNGYRDRIDINHPYSRDQIGEITRVMDLRGPVLYNYLDSTFDKLLASLEARGKANGPTYQELCEARKRGGFNTEEYVDTLALMSTRNRSRTPDLQDFMFSQGLESWLWHQDVPSVENQGWVEEINDFDDFATLD